VVLHPSSRVLLVATSLLQVAARSKQQQRQIDSGNGRVRHLIRKEKMQLFEISCIGI
jgi:hypothetical protein